MRPRDGHRDGRDEAWSRLADPRLDDGVPPVVRDAMGDAAFALHTLSTCSAHGWPSMNVGQQRDSRQSIDCVD